MRSLQTREEAEAKKKRNTLWMSIILIGIMVLSTAGYFSLSGRKNSSSGNENIQQVGDEWIVKYGSSFLRMKNSPESVNNVSVLISNDLNSYYGKDVYIASKNSGAKYEIGQNLASYAGRMQEACYGTCEENLPEKNCTENLIVFNDSAESKVYQEQNCVFIDGDLSAVDAFLYKIFGIN